MPFGIVREPARRCIPSCAGIFWVTAFCIAPGSGDGGEESCRWPSESSIIAHHIWPVFFLFRPPHPYDLRMPNAGMGLGFLPACLLTHQETKARPGTEMWLAGWLANIAGTELPMHPLLMLG